MRRDEAILRAAEKLFYERSFDGVGVDAIAREAGIVGSGIYRHFASKEEILSALIDQAADALLSELPGPGLDPHEELSLLVTAHVQFAIENPKMADIWQREHHILRKSVHRSHLRRQRRYIDRWVDCLDSCYPSHSREELLAVIRALHAMMTSDTTRRSGSRPAPGLADLLASLVLASLNGLDVSDGQSAAS